MVPFFQDDFFLFVILFWKGLDSPNNTIHDCTVRNRGPEQENNKKTTRKQQENKHMAEKCGTNMKKMNTCLWKKTTTPNNDRTRTQPIHCSAGPR
jgi:hypothetical protein